MTTLDNTQIISTVARVRSAFEARTTRPLEWRRTQLRRMVAMLEENEDRFSEASGDIPSRYMPAFYATRAVKPPACTP